MELKVLSWESGKAGEKISLNKEIFGQEVRLDILHRVVNWQLAKRRAGTHHVKEKGSVQASTRKIYNQKGSGRARYGSLKANLFRGGGVVFGPISRSHEFALNKKVRKRGLKVALSLRAQKEEIIIVDDIKLESGKASLFSKKLNNLGIKNALILSSELNKNLLNAASNLLGVDVLPVAGLNVVDLLKSRKIIMTLDGIKRLEERLI